MTNEMENNIKDEENIQYFADVTYYAIPPNQSKYKIFMLVAFNKKLYRTILCNISIIANENKETFITLLTHLKTKYNFIPKKFTIDYTKAHLISIKFIYPLCTIIPCFFHFMQNNAKRLPEIRHKNKTIKELAKDLLANIRLLCFIPLNKINSFYNEIKDKFRVKFPKYFIYFDKTYFLETSIFN